MADAAVVGSGPNGLAAAITLARAGLAVDVYEGAQTPGGGCRTAELTLPGFRHDVCSAVHPLLVASPFFRSIDLEGLGVRLGTPRVQFAHPLDDGRAGAVVASVSETASMLGRDERTYRRLFEPLVRKLDTILASVLRPIRPFPPPPLDVARFGLRGLVPASRLARRFETDEARAIVAGAAGHAMLPLSSPVTSSFGLLFLSVAHALGWPMVEGGSALIVAGLIEELGSLGGRVHTERWVKSLEDVGGARTVLLDVSPRQFVDLAGERLGRARRPFERFRYGPGVCKVDWALSGPVPWEAEICREAGTVHVCGPLEEVERSEADVRAGRHSEQPFCLVSQPCVVDPSRAPEGRHTLWGYCHVPSGSTTDMTEAIEAQIERFAPGFKRLVLARSTMTALEMEAYNPNYIGGDINGGSCDLRQSVLRPTAHWNPYRTPLKGVYLCSASTPPGGGVHGMCGMLAAQSALADLGA